MDILKRLSGWTDGMSNADVYKLAHEEIESLRAKLASQAQPTPSESDLSPTAYIKSMPKYELGETK